MRAGVPRTAHPGMRAGPGLLATLGLGVVPFDAEHARAATEAFLRFGKGRHAAGLNFGDCMAYAVAQAEGAPLLFTGDDFAKTDVARWDA